MTTPSEAIRIAIKGLQGERARAVRSGSGDANFDASNINQIDEEIAALEQAIKQLQQFETLRGILKSVVSEVI